jgi:hypothetical protein
MFDVFYSGTAPNLFAHEQPARDIEHAKELSRTRFFWWINYLTDYTDWDFLWEPVPWQSHQRHAWASQWQKDAGTYLVPKAGYTDTNYHSDRILTRLPNETNWRGMGMIDISWHPDPTEPPMIYQFGTQWQKTGGPSYHVPGATDVKYVDQPRIYKTQIDPYWVVPDACDVDTFDFTWHPDATDPPYVYQFGTQHQRTGGPRYQVPGAQEIKYVDQISIKTKPQAAFVYVIDHLDQQAELCKQDIPTELNHRVVRFFDNYLDTLKRIAQDAESRNLEYVWIVSSICDYANFDWTWHPEQWQATMLHVFASNEQKFGDTFFMHVPTFVYRSQGLELLEWYDLNYVQQSVPRRSMPVLQHQYDTHVEAVKTIEWSGPLAVFATNSVPDSLPTVALWRDKTRVIVPLDTGAESVIVPRSAISHIRSQLYDYAYIDKTQRQRASTLQDVIFISNGESMAEANWQHLKTICPRAQRSDGVTGREAAYKAAAALSTTPWFYAVFAKTEVLNTFAFDYAPDRMQQPKHYIFHSRNPLNGLEYGAMNINLYNRQLVLNTVPGLDFTLSAAHEVVPICASVSRFNTDPWVTWRSAFREVLKLKREVDLGADVEIQHRLRVWTTQAQGQNAEHCLQGAQDALNYYAQTQGRLEDLQQSFDWAWLQEYYYSLYQQRPWLESV